MTRAQKLLEKFKNSPQNLRFSEIKALAESLGYSFREGRGSHVLCYKDEKTVISFSVHNDDCKNVYKKKFINLIIS